MTPTTNPESDWEKLIICAHYNLRRRELVFKGNSVGEPILGKAR